MSNHIPWAAIAGTAPLERCVQPLHGGFAIWRNRTHGTLGPVVAHRPTSMAMSPDDGVRLLAYVHDNPVRAHVVCGPPASPWTSHRAYLGQAPTPPWLAVERGLQRCGLDATPRDDRHSTVSSAPRRASAAIRCSAAMASPRRGRRCAVAWVRPWS